MNFKKITSVALSMALLASSMITSAPQLVSAAETASSPVYVGNVKLAGDTSFDSDSIVNSDSTQWRWLSYPGSRMIENPGDRSTYDGGMNLNFGLDANGLKTASSLQKIQMSATGQPAKDATGITTAWYPYKLTARAVYTDGTLNMSEFFVDKNTFVRYIDASGVTGKTMAMSAETSGLSVQTDGSMLVDKGEYYFVYKVILLNSDSSVNKIIKPTVNGNIWSAQIPFTTDTAKVAFSLSLAVKADGVSAAIARSNDAATGKLSDKLAATKTYWDGLLAKVPAPTVWGIQGGLDNGGVTPAQHRRAFYAAWAFNYQNIVEPTPETGYNYYQVTLGKASMYTGGPIGAPSSCSWESMFDIQEMALVEPDIAWSAAEGFVNSVDATGLISGESLPSQLAHTVWICYQNKKDDAKLASLYPNIKRHLLWRAENPRWIWASHNYADEKDISFVAQWYSDVDYAIQMCQVLGNQSDITMWQNMKTQMGENARKWFFTPASGDPTNKIYNFYFTDTNVHHAYDRPDDDDDYIDSALYGDLPTDLMDKLVAHYVAAEKPTEDIVGLNFYKYGDGNLIAHGLYEQGTKYSALTNMWQRFTNAALRHVIKTVEFCEVAYKDAYRPDGVHPSTFAASTVIDFTYMNNGMRIDLGTPVAIADASTGLKATANSNVTAYTIKGTAPSLPKTVVAADSTGAPVTAYVTWDTIDPSKYATAGTFTVSGKLADTSVTVTATVKVYGGTVTVDPITANTLKGVVPTLPASVTATYQQDSITQKCAVNITWNAMQASDFANTGSVTVNGTIGFSGQAVQATVNVSNLTIQGASSVGQYQTLQLAAKDESGNPVAVVWGIKDADTDPAANVSDNGILLGVKTGTVTVTAQPVSMPGVTITKEITITTPKNVQSFAYGGTATVSTQADAARGPAQAIDEDYSSVWRAGANDTNQWFQLKMQKDIPVTGVKISWFTEPNHNDIPKYVLKASENGTDWTTVHTAASTPLAGDIIVFDQPVKAQYFRMEVTAPGDFTMGIYEFQVFGVPTITTPVQTIAITSGTGAFQIVNKSVALPLSATVSPSGATDSRVEWTVTNTDGSPTDVASVSTTGVVTPLKNGAVKVTATAADGSGVSATQQVAISNQDLTNVALKKSVTATTDGGGLYVPSAAVDGDMSTRWGSAGSAPQNSAFTIDLGGAYDISTVSLYCDPGAYPIDFELQYSNDNVNWTDIKNVTGNSSPNMTYIFTPVSAKYVRTLSSKTSNSGWSYSIFEFQVFGSPNVGTVTATADKTVLGLNGTTQLHVTAKQNDGTTVDLSGASISYQSSDSSIVSVDDKGVATAKAAGSAQIWAAVTLNGVQVSSAKIGISVDTAAPTGTAISFTKNPFKTIAHFLTFGLFFGDTVTVNITASDTGSGIDHYAYQLVADGGTFDANAAWTTGSSFSIHPDFKGTVYARAVDKVGNVSGAVNKSLVVDKTTPVITVDSTTLQTMDENASIPVTVTDKGAGIGTVSYQVNGGAVQTTDLTTDSYSNLSESYQFTIDNLPDGYYDVVISCQDNSGNNANSVTVHVDKGGVPTVTGVSVSPNTATVKRGQTQVFSASVSGANSPATTVTWSVSGNASANTKVGTDGKLIVGADETAKTIRVTATSTADPSKSATVTVTVGKSDDSSSHPGSTAPASNPKTGSESLPVLPLALFGAGLATVLVMRKRSRI